MPALIAKQKALVDGFMDDIEFTGIYLSEIRNPDSTLKKSAISIKEIFRIYELYT